MLKFNLNLLRNLRRDLLLYLKHMRISALVLDGVDVSLSLLVSLLMYLELAFLVFLSFFKPEINLPMEDFLPVQD